MLAGIGIGLMSFCPLGASHSFPNLMVKEIGVQRSSMTCLDGTVSEWQDWDSNPVEVSSSSGGLGALRWEWAGNREKDTVRKERVLSTFSAPNTSLC